jgi:hypothetical protein
LHEVAEDTSIDAVTRAIAAPLIIPETVGRF